MSLTPLLARPGINSDDTTFACGRAWTGGNNVRFDDGKPQVIEGWTESTVLPDGIACYGIGAQRVAGVIYILFGMFGGKLYATNAVGNPPMNITPATFPGATSFSFDAFGAEALICPRGDTLYRWNGTGAAAEIAQAPDRITDMLVTSERQVLAFGCNEEISATFNPLCIRGSDLEDCSNWTTSSTNNAFEHILDGPGLIVGARRVGQYVAVWTTAALFIGQFIGDPSQTYRFDLVDLVTGPPSRDAICVLDGTAYWMGTDLLLHVWAPGSPPGVVPCPIRNELVANYDIGFSDSSTRMMVHPVHDEVWFFYTDTRDGSGDATRYVAYSPRESAACGAPVWFKGKLTTSAVHASPVVNELAQNPYAWISASGDAWLGPLGAVKSALTTRLHGDTGDDVHDGGSGPIIPSITLGDIYLDEGQRRTMIRSFRPDFGNQAGDIILTIKIRDHPQSTPIVKGPYSISPGATKMDLRASGMIASFTFSNTDDACAFRVGKPEIDIVTLGER
jgi:hypothetical protein